MCLKRDNDDICNKFLNPIPVDDTIDEFETDENDMEIQQRIRYLLMSNDEEESDTGYLNNMEVDSDEDEDDDYIHSSTNHDSSDEINQNANSPSVSVNMNSNILETNNTDQSSEHREFELNIPQILLSMSRISYNLNNLTEESHD